MKTKAQEGTHCRLLLRNLQARLQEMLEHLWWKETQLGTKNLHFKPSSSTVLCLGKKRQNFKFWEIQHTNTRCSPPLPYPKLMNIRRARKALHSKTVACISLFQERHFNSFLLSLSFYLKEKLWQRVGVGAMWQEAAQAQHMLKTRQATAGDAGTALWSSHDLQGSRCSSTCLRVLTGKAA